MIVELETERLRLRKYCIDDVEAYHLLQSNSRVWEFSTYKPAIDSEQSRKRLSETIDKYQASNVGFCALLNKRDDTYIGEAGIIGRNVEFKKAVWGYNLLPEYWGKGYATEISKTVAELFFAERALVRLEAMVIEGNAASRRVLEKVQFRMEGLMKNYVLIDGKFHNVCMYALVKDGDDFNDKR